jgi:chromosome segregation and condensation protein ScpB
MSLLSQIESILFVSHQPLSLAQLKKLTDGKKGEIEDALSSITNRCWNYIHG